MRESAERAADTGSSTAQMRGGMSAEVDGGESLTAACCAWSWKIKVTDNTDMTADRTPSSDRTIRERWLYTDDIFQS